MTFFPFEDGDIIDTNIVAHPFYGVEKNGDQVTGSVYLEKEFLDDALATRMTRGFSLKEGGIVEKNWPLTSSIDIIDVESGATNSQFYQSVLSLYNYYSLINGDYTASFGGVTPTRYRVILFPEIYYDKSILTGSFSASDKDSSGDDRLLFDDGRGGIYSGSLTGTLVGNIFYNEGFAVLKGGGLNVETDDFGEDSSTNFKWKISFRGVHKIPVKIFRCRAPAGQLNASSNPTYYQIPSGTSDTYRNQREIILTGSSPYITTVGLYDDNFDLIGLCKLGQPVKKDENQDLLFRVRIDF